MTITNQSLSLLITVLLSATYQWSTVSTTSEKYHSGIIPQRHCRTGERLCRNGQSCVAGLLLCDGVRDCPDGSDEGQHCEMAHLCQEGFYFCSDRSYPPCIHRDKVCDGNFDCYDGSDESICGYCPRDFCKNGGDCSIVKGAPVCKCKEGWTQNRCTSRVTEKEVTENRENIHDQLHCPRDFCKNGGDCFIVRGTPVCKCKAGWTQNRCTSRITGEKEVTENKENVHDRPRLSKVRCPADEHEPWSYDAKLKNGPDYWGETYSNCYGVMQSPIDIVTDDVERDGNLEKIKLNNYDKTLTQFKVENNGHTVKVTPLDGIERTALINGNLYKLDQFHFHWGDKYYTGSEHTIDGSQYALELHFVHIDRNGRIAVVAEFYRVSLNPNSALNPITDSFERIKYRGDKVEVNGQLRLDKLVEKECPYYRYNGSLTTPGCDEGVTWSICKNSLNMGYSQIEEFRKLYSARKNEREDISNCKITNNFRPIQPLNKRIIKESSEF